MDDKQIKGFWRIFLATLPADSPVRDERYATEGWGDYPGMADELGALIASGTKTATCSALWEYEAEGEPLPETRVKTIVLNGDDPLCIVETTEFEVVRYGEVHAQKERVTGRSTTGGMRTGVSSPHAAQDRQRANYGYVAGMGTIPCNL
jgi:ASCH domain